MFVRAGGKSLVAHVVLSVTSGGSMDARKLEISLWKDAGDRDDDVGRRREELWESE